VCSTRRRRCSRPGDGALAAGVALPLPCIAVHTSRERLRTLVRAALPPRRARLLVVHTAAALERAFHRTLIDAALVDVATNTDDAWQGAALAREFPSAPFFAVTPLRSTDAPILARCVELELADVVIDGVDDAAIRAIVLAAAFRARFAVAMAVPPVALGLASKLQRDTWSCVVAHAGLPVRTDTIAKVVGVTREHLSRSFAAGGAPNLKRAIDLVRLVAAAELAKNPGYDMRDVATVLAFASASHLSSTAQRIIGMRPTALCRLRAVDLFSRFAAGRGRSRRSVSMR
jgi:AraC-like DNA-binding protein